MNFHSDKFHYEVLVSQQLGVSIRNLSLLPFLSTLST